MPHRVHHPIDLIYSVGTQVVARVAIIGSGGHTLHPPGAVGKAMLSL